MGSESKSSLTVSLAIPSGQRWGQSFPIEIRDANKLVLRAQGLSDDVLKVPPGRYMVSAVLPNGQQAAVEDVVELLPGEDKKLKLTVSDLEFPAALDSAPSLGATVKDLLRPLTQYLPGPNAAILRGNWLAYKLASGQASQTLKREPFARSILELTFADIPAWLEISTSSLCSYVAVPIDEGGHTAIQWKAGADATRPVAIFDFKNGELNSFYDFIQNGHALEARSLSQPLIAQSEHYLADKRRSPLRAALGAYVLLRANELEFLDGWTGHLLSVFPWLPDALAIRMEYLARTGRHREALDRLLELPIRGAPWFRSGISYLAARSKIYLSAALSGKSDLAVLPAELDNLKQIAPLLGELSAALDLTQSVCTFHNVPRLPRNLG